MQSLTSHLARIVIRATRKKAFQTPEAMNEYIAKARQSEDFHPPAIISRNLHISQRVVNGGLVYDVTPPDAHPDKRILYFHGGAYCFEITSYHWRLIAEMARRLKVQITVPIYPLAPEHRFDAIFGMVMSVYRSALETSAPQDIVLMGDSAGGNMAVVLTMLAAEAGLPSPGAHVLISPGLDMTLENPATVAQERDDPWLAIPGGLEAIRHYAPDIARADWRISPILGNLSILPRTLLLTGTRDLLTPDNIRFVELVRGLGGDIEMVLGQGMFHVWPLINMPEARRARDAIVEFLSRDAADARKNVPLAANDLGGLSAAAS